MAGIDTGGESGKRAVNRDIPLVPFIDFLLCLISFLLITAVWSQNARLEADAQMPGDSCGGCRTPPETKQLHVAVRDRKFELTWKQGATVLARSEIDKKPVRLADGDPTYPDLARRVSEEWKRVGSHRAPSDPVRDQVVLHSANTLEFGELAAVMDAIGAAKRDRNQPAFNVSFAVN